MSLSKNKLRYKDLRWCTRPPAAVFPVSYRYEGLQVGSLQAVLQQLFGRVDVLGDPLHALVQHPRALADLALCGMRATQGEGMISEEVAGRNEMENLEDMV